MEVVINNKKFLVSSGTAIELSGLLNVPEIKTYLFEMVAKRPEATKAPAIRIDSDLFELFKTARPNEVKIKLAKSIDWKKYIEGPKAEGPKAKGPKAEKPDVPVPGSVSRVTRIMSRSRQIDFKNCDDHNYDDIFDSLIPDERIQLITYGDFLKSSVSPNDAGELINYINTNGLFHTQGIHIYVRLRTFDLLSVKNSIESYIYHFQLIKFENRFSLLQELPNDVEMKYLMTKLTEILHPRSTDLIDSDIVGFSIVPIDSDYKEYGDAISDSYFNDFLMLDPRSLFIVDEHYSIHGSQIRIRDRSESTGELKISKLSPNEYSSFEVFHVPSECVYFLSVRNIKARTKAQFDNFCANIMIVFDIFKSECREIKNEYDRFWVSQGFVTRDEARKFTKEHLLPPANCTQILDYPRHCEPKRRGMWLPVNPTNKEKIEHQDPSTWIKFPPEPDQNGNQWYYTCSSNSGYKNVGIMNASIEDFMQTDEGLDHIDSSSITRRLSNCVPCCFDSGGGGLSTKEYNEKGATECYDWSRILSTKGEEARELKTGKLLSPGSYASGPDYITALYRAKVWRMGIHNGQSWEGVDEFAEEIEHESEPRMLFNILGFPLNIYDKYIVSIDSVSDKMLFFIYNEGTERTRGTRYEVLFMSPDGKKDRNYLFDTKQIMDLYRDLYRIYEIDPPAGDFPGSMIVDDSQELRTRACVLDHSIAFVPALKMNYEPTISEDALDLKGYEVDEPEVNNAFITRRIEPTDAKTELRPVSLPDIPYLRLLQLKRRFFSIPATERQKFIESQTPEDQLFLIPYLNQPNMYNFDTKTHLNDFAGTSADAGLFFKEQSFIDYVKENTFAAHTVPATATDVFNVVLFGGKLFSLTPSDPPDIGSYTIHFSISSDGTKKSTNVSKYRKISIASDDPRLKFFEDSNDFIENPPEEKTLFLEINEKYYLMKDIDTY